MAGTEGDTHDGERAPERSAQQLFHAKVASRLGLLPNFFLSARTAPELMERMWDFAQAAYLDNPMPTLFKERLLVYLSRFCPARYCIMRHVAFLLGHGHPSGDITCAPQTVEAVVKLLQRPTPWSRDMDSVYQRLAASPNPMADWPEPDTELEDVLFACVTLVFNEPARSEQARTALVSAIGERRYEFLAGYLALVRVIHYWALLHPEIEPEEDINALLRDHEELAALLLQDPESERSEMGSRLFAELTTLRELQQRSELERAKRALEEKDRQKDQFIAVLAHELRNPLAAIRAATDALAVTGTADSRSEHFRALVDRQSTAMTRMLDDLLDASRVALGKVAVSIEDLDCSESIRSLAAEHAARAQAAGLTITVQLPEAPCYIRADGVRLRQVIDNLLSNAIRFTPPPGQIALELSPQETSVVVRVTDTGVGFDAAIAERLFDPFFQAGTDLARRAGGLGLGLAISARLAELQGGRLRAASGGLGKGATFSLTMPRSANAPRGATQAATAQVAGRGRVLVVEDNTEVANGLAELIRLLGFDVLIAKDGYEALAQARQAIPDIILCDLGLPDGMDGYAVARAVKSDPLLSSVRLIAATGYSRPEDYTSARAAGFEHLIPKPLTLESLRALLFPQ